MSSCLYKLLYIRTSSSPFSVDPHGTRLCSFVSESRAFFDRILRTSQLISLDQDKVSGQEKKVSEEQKKYSKVYSL